MILKQRLLKMFCVFSIGVLAALSLAACSNSKIAVRGMADKTTICHATGNANDPYNEITVDLHGLRGHSNHQNDLIPAPDNGCPPVLATPTVTMTPTMTITPTITLTPTTTATPTITLTPTTTVTPTMTVTPTVTTTPATTTPGNNEKITICHATGSSKNSYVLITVSANGLNGHGKHARDIIPAPAEGCPK